MWYNIVMDTQILQKNTGRFQKGQKPWNTNIHYTDEQKKRMNFSGLDKGRAWNKGQKFPQFSDKNHWNWKGATICECGAKKSNSSKTCKKCFIKRQKNTMKGNKNGLGIKHTIESKRLMSISRIQNPPKIFKDTKIEIIIENLLKKYKIDYLKQEP